MGNVQEFRDAIAEIESKKEERGADSLERILQREKGLDYVRDMNNWLCVHATRYLPIKSQDGGMYIPTTAMATGFEKWPRSTVHFTLNHVVASHGYGSWDDTPFIVLVPYGSVVKLNDNPAEVAATDTYWSVDPDVGLRLPENTYIIKPSNDALFSIGENGATYKTDNFTDEEIAQIESMMNPYDRQMYDKYKNADFSDAAIEDMLLYSSDIVKKMYAGSRDKKAFLRGMFEESKYEILTKYLRNAVVEMAMNKIGYQYVRCGDACEKSVAIAQTARENGLDANESNKGHGYSVYAAMEEVHGDLNHKFNGGILYDGLYNHKNVDALYNELVKMQKGFYIDKIIDSLINNKPIDIYELYLRRFKQELEWRKIKVKTIAEFDKNLEKTLRRNADALSKKHIQWLNQIKQWPGYDNLIIKLKALRSPAQFIEAERDF